MHKHIDRPIAVLLMIIIVFGLSACDRESRAPTRQTSRAIPEVSLYHYFSGDLDGGIGEMISIVNSRQSNWRVAARALDHEAFKTMIHSTLANGSPPELFTYWAGARTQALVDRRQIVPIDDVWQSAGLDRVFPRTISEAASTYNGSKYLLPITQHIVVFFFNKQLLDRERLKPPTNWQEFTAMCDTLTARGITAIALGARERWPAQFWFDYLLLRTAGAEYRAALMQGEAAYTDPQTVAAYRLWAELIEKGYFNRDAENLNWAEATEKVCRGEAAATLMGTWAIQTLIAPPCNLSPEKDFDFFPFPVIDDHLPVSSVGPVDGIALTRESSNHQYAKTVLAYFAEAQAQQLMSNGSGALSPSTAVPRTFYPPFKQRLFDAIEKSDHWAFNYDLATPPLVAERGMDSFAELLAYPNQYEEILQMLQDEAAGLFADLKNQHSKIVK